MILLAVSAGCFFYFAYQVTNSTFSGGENKVFEISEGESTRQIGERLRQEGFIKNEIYFFYYVWANDLKGQIKAGSYEIGPGFRVPEIANILVSGNDIPRQVRVTFPEGWTIEKMAERLTASGLDGDGFLELARNPDKELVSKFGFLADIPEGASLEGFLFPDTYFFTVENTAGEIIEKMLVNFDRKLGVGFREDIESQDKTIFDVVTMASIIEAEGKIPRDKDLVSGIFWKRLEIGMPLQSDATLTYILNVRKRQYSFQDTRVESPYNTYLHRGLPPGPVSNPGLVSLKSSIYPEESEYLYFLNNPDTGETFFARTLDEHNINKARNGL